MTSDHRGSVAVRSRELPGAHAATVGTDQVHVFGLAIAHALGREDLAVAVGIHALDCGGKQEKCGGLRINIMISIIIH